MLHCLAKEEQVTEYYVLEYTFILKYSKIIEKIQNFKIHLLNGGAMGNFSLDLLEFGNFLE